MCKDGAIIRSSRDTKINEYGRQLISLCKATSMLLVNGRIKSDPSCADYTCVGSMGSSTVDFFVGSARLFHTMSDFKIHDRFPESDHKLVSISLETQMHASTVDCSTNNVQWTPIYKYTWEKGDLLEFAKNLSDDISLTYCNKLFDLIAELKPVETVALAYGQILTQALKRTCEYKKAKPPKQIHKLINVCA